MNTEDLQITPRAEGSRDTRPLITTPIAFSLDEIKEHFDISLESVRNQFQIADELLSQEKTEECKNIWRSQIIFIESIFDFYIHELSKCAMMNMFSNKWNKSPRYNNFSIPMRCVEEAISNVDSTDWLMQYINERFSKEVYLSYEAMKDQLNLSGLPFRDILDNVFPRPQHRDANYRDGKTIIRELFERRNKIAHQLDRDHSTAAQNDITKEYVERCIDEIVKLVEAFHNKAKEIDASSNLA